MRACWPRCYRHPPPIWRLVLLLPSKCCLLLLLLPNDFWPCCHRHPPVPDPAAAAAWLPQDILAPLLHVNELRKHGVTLHMLLEAERQPIPDVPAVYFVQVGAQRRQQWRWQQWKQQGQWQQWRQQGQRQQRRQQGQRQHWKQLWCYSHPAWWWWWAGGAHGEPGEERRCSQVQEWNCASRSGGSIMAGAAGAVAMEEWWEPQQQLQWQQQGRQK